MSTSDELNDDGRLGTPSPDFEPTLYGLAAVVYAERDGQILLLKRAGGALSGQWFLPGGAVEPGELPEAAARRELVEESGLDVDGELELVGAYPIWVYGGDCLQLSYRGTLAEGDVVVSDEHEGARWVDPVDMRSLLTDEVIDAMAAGNERVAALVHGVRTDLDRYIARIGRRTGAMRSRLSAPRRRIARVSRSRNTFVPRSNATSPGTGRSRPSPGGLRSEPRRAWLGQHSCGRGCGRGTSPRRRDPKGGASRPRRRAWRASVATLA